MKPDDKNLAAQLKKAQKENKRLLEDIEALEESDLIFKRVIFKLMADNGGKIPEWLLEMMDKNKESN